MILEGKNVVVGVTASISAYKACELVRALQKDGANVRVALTPRAREFVGEMTFKALTGDLVLWDWRSGPTSLEHIYWARWADALAIAPASANTMAKVRFGMADNFLTTLALAYDKPIVFAPAMNTKMFENVATQENIKALQERGHIIVDPECGQLACGEEGAGKLADVEDIKTAIMYAIFEKPLKGKKVLITAGGTREFFDPIRYISNNSSGKLGHELAKWAYILGAEKVYLVSAPTCERKPYCVERFDVVSTDEMYQKVMELMDDVDVIIMNAAVADFKPQSFSEEKLKKDKQSLTVELQPNVDILKELGKKKKEGQVLIGFAAESQDLEKNALEKLNKKNLDAIVANDTSVFSSDTFHGKIILKDGTTVEIPPVPKDEAAYKLLKLLADSIL